MIARTTRFISALGAAFTVAAAAGCGGGGSATAPSATTTPVSTAAATRLTGTLSLVFPPGFHRVQTAAENRSAATARTPAYVNPTHGYVLDVYVNGVLAPNLDGITTNGDSITIAPASDGTQSFGVPMYSNSANDIAVVEYDDVSTNSARNPIALGETNLTQTFAPGAAPQIGVQLLMIATGIAYDAGDSSGLTAHPTGGSASACGVQTMFLFVTDADGGLASTPGYGVTSTGYAGTVIPTATVPGTNGGIASPYQGGYRTDLPASSSVSATITAPNPAAAVFVYGSDYPSFASFLYGLNAFVVTPLTSTETFTCP